MNFKRYHESKNLFDKTADYTTGTTTYNYTINGLDPNKYYTCSTNYERISGVTTASLYFNGGDSINNGVWSGTPRTFRPNSNGEITVYIRYRESASAPPIIDDVMAGTIWVMVNEGSTPLPYEPYSSEVWHDIPHYIHNTSTDTLTTLPADIYANDNNATVGLKGDMSQTGTPTPTTPIQPSECGERTGNLLNLRATGYYIANNGVETPNNNFNLYDLSVNPGETYTINCDYREQGNTTIRVCGFDSTETYNALIVQQNASTVPITFTIPENTTLIKFSIRSGTTDVIIAAGETAEYVPVGYKIPILNNSQTTNVYLGEVQSTRRIKQLVLTGEENFVNQTVSGIILVSLTRPVDMPQYTSGIISSHFVKSSPASNVGEFYVGGSYINFNYDGINDVTTFKTYLQQQYSNGTPVCVWYVLATPTTRIVNEPLRKIGDYADTVSSITIPTIAGANTISIGTTLQPSEVSVNYKGWHPVQSVHERENGAWT